MTILRGADSTDAPLLPHGLDVYCPYRDGLYANEADVRGRFPGKIILPITVRNGRAPCDDIEPGNGTPSDAESWWRREITNPEADGRPWYYAARAQMQEILANLRGAGIHRRAYRLWVAHPNGVPHICSGATCGFGLPDDVEGTQYVWNPGGVNIDLSLFRADAFGQVPPPPPPKFMVLQNRIFIVGGLSLNERSVYRHAQGAMQHPAKYRNYLHQLYTDLKLLRDRLKHVAYDLDPLPNGRPSWSKYARGTRWKILNDMMKDIAKAL